MAADKSAVFFVCLFQARLTYIVRRNKCVIIKKNGTVKMLLQPRYQHIITVLSAEHITHFIKLFYAVAANGISVKLKAVSKLSAENT